MRRKLWWLGIAVLSLALVGQYVSYRFYEKTSGLNAAWADNSSSFNEVVSKAQNVVQGQVQIIQRGPDIVLKAPAEPGGEVRIPTENVSIIVQSTEKGAVQAGQTITVFRTGGELNVPAGPARSPGAVSPPNNTLRERSPFGTGKPAADVKAPEHPAQPAAAPNTPPSANDVNITENLDDDPSYQVGETYFLALTDGPNGTLRPVSPAGRYRVTSDNRLQAVADDQISASVNGRAVSDAVQVARGQLTIAPGGQVQKRVTTPGMPTTGLPTDNLVVLLAVGVALAGLTIGFVIRRRRA